MNAKVLKSLLVAIVMICVSTYYVKSQSIIGAYGNYAGSHGALLNPSSLTTSDVYADFGLNVGVSAANNYFHVKSKDAYKAIFDTTFKMTYSKIINELPRSFEYDFNYNISKPVTVNVDIDATILSGMYSFKGKHAVGFFARARSNIGFQNVPNSLVEMGVVGFSHNYYSADGLVPRDTTVHYTQYAGNYSDENMNIGVMAWSEFGVSYSTAIYERYHNRIDLGVNAKLALAYGACALSAKQFDYHLDKNSSNHVIDSLWFFDYLDGGIAYSMPVGYDTPFIVDNKFNKNLLENHINGLGGGIDIGVTYTYKRSGIPERWHKMNCEVDPIDYVWRVGLSVIDLGAVYFNKKYAEVADYNVYNAILNTKKFYKINTVHQFMDVVNDAFDSEVVKKGFWMGMPTALSLQFDYNVFKHFYVNAIVIQPVRLFNYQVSRDAQLLLSPRFESQWFDFTVPVAVVNYERLLVGASFRAAFLTIGTQNLMNLIGIGDVYGLDFYVSLKFNFNKGKCRTSGVDDCTGSYNTPKKYSYTPKNYRR